MGLGIPVVVSTKGEIQDVIEKYPSAEVYVSRGAVGEALEEISNKPVIELTSSINDIFEPLQKLIEKGIKKVAVMASPKLIGDKAYDYKIEDVEILMRPYEVENVDSVAGQLQNIGVEGIVGGSMAFKAAERYGMKAESLDNGISSIKQAVSEAVKIAKAQENEWLKQSKKAEKIHQYSTELYAALQQAVAAVEELTSSSEELAATSQETSNIANKAFQEVKNTTAILDIIRQVAKRTNLLGLNASIEAARAGESGRGFSVVAVEVRKLSEESNTSARKIDDMLNKFRNSVEAVLKNVEQSNIITQDQAKANQNIAQMLDSLRGIGEKLMDMVEG
jgi:methyl-accepting chemotaxis protein